MKKILIVLSLLALIATACDAVVAGESGTMPFPGQAPAIEAPPIEVPAAPPASAPLEPPAIVVPRQGLDLPQQQVPDTLTWEDVGAPPSQEVLQRFAEASQTGEGEGIDAKKDVEFGDPNNLDRWCRDKLGLPSGAKSYSDVVRSPGGEAVLRYFVDANGQPIGQGVLSRVPMPSGQSFITHNLQVFAPYGDRGIATQMADILNQDWIKAFPETAAQEKVVWINLHPQRKYSCYWRDKVESDPVKDWDGESVYKTHWLIPPGIL